MPGNKAQLISALKTALVASQTKTVDEAATLIANAIDNYAATIKARVPASSFCAQAQGCVPNTQLDLSLV